MRDIRASLTSLSANPEHGKALRRPIPCRNLLRYRFRSTSAPENVAIASSVPRMPYMGLARREICVMFRNSWAVKWASVPSMWAAWAFLERQHSRLLCISPVEVLNHMDKDAVHPTAVRAGDSTT